MRVLVAGAGYVGMVAAARLAGLGHEVTALRRSEVGTPPGVRLLRADLTDASSLGTLPEVDAVAVTISAGGRDPARYRTAYLDAPATLLRVLHDRGDPLRQVVFTSSTAVYGGQAGGIVDADTPVDPDTATAEVVAEAERAVLDADVPGTVVRLSGIYGPGRTRLVDRVREGRATCPPSPEWTNRVHRDDAAGAVVHVLTHERERRVWLASDDEPAERCDVYRWLADRLGVAPPPQDPEGGSGRGTKRCDNSHLRASGWAPAYPSFREGYAELVDAEPGRTWHSDDAHRA